MLKRCALTLCLVAAIAGCSAARSEEPSEALASADLSAQDFDTAVQQLSALPWLPWTYLSDGCDARAKYYSMLLAAKGIPTNHIYVRVKSLDAPKLFGRWSWHVAPVVTKAGDMEHLWVLDPAVDQTKALTSIEWVAKQTYPDPSAADYPELDVMPVEGAVIVMKPMANPGPPDVASNMEPTLAEMPGFRIEFVSSACVVMHEYIDLEESTTPPMKEEKHRALGRETQRIVSQLDAKGKVIFDYDHAGIASQQGLSADCTRNEPLP